MKTLKFFILGSLLIIAINFALAIYATMNGTYDATQVQRMVPFIFILIISMCVWVVTYVAKKIIGYQRKVRKL